MANLFQPKTAVIEYRPALIDGSFTWYWSLLPLPDEAHAVAHGHGKSRGHAALEARQNARKHGYKISQVRIKHNFTEAAARRISGLMSLREARKKKLEIPQQPDPDAIDPKEVLNTLPARYWLVSIEAVQAQEVIDYYVIAFDEKDAVERLRKRGVIRPEPEDYVAAVIEVPKSDYDQFLKWQEEFGVYESVSSEAAKAEEPSEEQAEAGNYKMGHTSLFGLKISIENAKGSTRSGKGKDGKEWSVTMPAHYGYIKGTVGKDKDHIDVYIGPDEDSEKVYVVNQQHEEGGFDEHKCMICFADRETAIKTYDKAFTGDLGPKLRQSVVSTTMDKFKDWLESGDPKKPFKSLAESLLEADPDDVPPKHYLQGTLRALPAQMEVPNYEVAQQKAREDYEQALGKTFVVDHITGCDENGDDHYFTGEFTVRVKATPDDLVTNYSGEQFVDPHWFVEIISGPPEAMQKLAGTDYHWIYGRSFLLLGESADPDSISPKDYLEKLPKIQRCPYCRGTELSPENQAGYVYCFHCDKEFRPSIWNKVFEADPDAVNPKDYLLNNGPFGTTQVDGKWYLTFEGEPREWFPDQKNASFYADNGNELHKTKPFRGGLENAIDWFWREKYGKTREMWSPHYKPARGYGRRRRYESADPDDPADYLKSTRLQDCPACHKNDWEWFRITVPHSVKPVQVYRCKSCNLHWRPDMNPSPKFGDMGGCWFPSGPTKPLDEATDPDAINPKDFIDNVYTSPVPGYTTKKREQYENSWELWKRERYGEEDTLVMVGLILYDRQKEATPAWQDYHWCAQPSDMSNGQYFKSFDEAVRWLAEKTSLPESVDPDNIDPKAYLSRVQLQYRYSLDVDLPGDEGYTASVDLPISPPSGTAFDDSIDDPIWVEDFYDKLRKTQFDPDDIAWIVEIRYRGQSSYTESEDPDAVNPREFFDRTFPVKASMIDFVWALEYIDARAVGVRKEGQFWYVYGHIFSNQENFDKAIQSLIDKFKLSVDFDRTRHSLPSNDVVDAEEYNRTFSMYIPIHEISPPTPDDYFPPGSHVRPN